MFNNLREFKTLLVDLSSVGTIWDNEWDNLDEDINILFCSSKQDRLDDIDAIYDDDRIETMKLSRGFAFGAGQLIQMICKEKELNITDTVILTSDWNMWRSIKCYPVNVILLSKDGLSDSEMGEMPDFVIDTIDIINDIKSGKQVGYVAEHRAASYGESCNVMAKVIAHKYDGKYKVISGGRYFETRDGRSKFNPLAARIKKNKQHQTNQTDVFETVYRYIIARCVGKGVKIEGITRIPPRPSDVNDRFEIVVRNLATSYNIKNMCNDLTCMSDYRKQKGLNAQQRRENVKGVFEASEVVKGKTILIIDDVLTTGATMFEAVDELYRKGAKEVVIGVLAINQFQIDTKYDAGDIILCGSCEKPMVVRVRNDKKLFFGCTSYPECENGEDYIRGRAIVLDVFDMIMKE